MIKQIFEKKTIQEISLEWDLIAEKRIVEIKNGNDKSFKYILFPEIYNNIKKYSNNNLVVIDCGCGTGEITNSKSNCTKEMIGIDISERSIVLAKQNYISEKIHFYNTSIEDYSLGNKECADICILNMVLSNVLDCSNVCIAVNYMLRKEGKMFITIPHPCYWPQYWGYDKNDWFDYNNQIYMTSDFCITGIGSLGLTTHIHRPLGQYISSITQSGLFRYK